MATRTKQQLAEIAEIADAAASNRIRNAGPAFSPLAHAGADPSSTKTKKSPFTGSGMISSQTWQSVCLLSAMEGSTSFASITALHDLQIALICKIPPFDRNVRDY